MSVSFCMAKMTGSSMFTPMFRMVIEMSLPWPKGFCRTSMKKFASSSWSITLMAS